MTHLYSAFFEAMWFTLSAASPDHSGALLVEDSRRPRNDNKLQSRKGHVVLNRENQERVRLENGNNMCGLRKAFH